MFLRPGIIVTITFLAINPAFAQSDEEAVMRTINQLFDGMRAGDSAKVRETFHPAARLGRALADGTFRARGNTPDGFIAAVGGEHERVWDERIWDWEVQIDDNLATVWAKYAFYFGDQFHHCGVNAFQLVRESSGWKIVNLVDTSREDQANCELPEQ